MDNCVDMLCSIPIDGSGDPFTFWMIVAGVVFAGLWIGSKI